MKEIVQINCVFTVLCQDSLRDLTDTHLALFGNSLYEEVGANVVYIGHQYGAVIRCGVRWVDVLFHSAIPVNPLT